MAELSLPDKIVAIDRALDGAEIRHAFGGALALAYYTEPRATIDVDVNVFVPPARFGDVVTTLAPLGVRSDADATTVERTGQCRLWWNTTPIDIFFAYDAIHAAMEHSSRRVPFGDVSIAILSAEHLVVCKAAFERPKDWIDIEQVLVLHPAIGRDEIVRWLGRLLGPEDRRTRRVETLLDEMLGPEPDAPSRLAGS
jgi:hypothetical protein